MSWRDVVTHEIMHAQYFNQPRYKEVVDSGVKPVQVTN